LARVWPDAPNVTDDDAEVAAVRYRRVRRDASSSLEPALRILFEEEGADTYERLPIAAVRSGKRPSLDDAFAPPLLRAPSCPWLDRGVRDVIGALVARRAELLAAREARPLDLGGFEPSRAPQLLLLSAVNEALAVLEHPSRVASMSPASLHGALAGLLGTVQALDGHAAVAMPTYLHESPGPSFRTLIDGIVDLLPRVALDPHVAFPLRRIDAQTFSLHIETPELFRKRAYLLASGADESILASIVPAFAKIGSSESLPMLVRSAVRGAPVALEFDPPSSLPSDATHCVFKIDTRSPYWSDILTRRSLLVHLPEAPSTLTLVACAIPEER
jgi:type VI secretion system ImpJ/VasE family protein